DSTSTCTRRNRSNTPLQALTLLNDQGFFELAQGLAARILKEAGSDDGARIRHAFRLCFARSPSAIEETRLRELLSQQLRDFDNARGDAQLLERSSAAKGEGEIELTAWTTVARVLLNLDEF